MIVSVTAFTMALVLFLALGTWCYLCADGKRAKGTVLIVLLSAFCGAAGHLGVEFVLSVALKLL